MNSSRRSTHWASQRAREALHSERHLCTQEQREQFEEKRLQRMNSLDVSYSRQLPVEFKANRSRRLSLGDSKANHRCGSAASRRRARDRDEERRRLQRMNSLDVSYSRQLPVEFKANQSRRLSLGDSKANHRCGSAASRRRARDEERRRNDNEIDLNSSHLPSSTSPHFDVDKTMDNESHNSIALDDVSKVIQMASSTHVSSRRRDTTKARGTSTRRNSMSNFDASQRRRRRTRGDSSKPLPPRQNTAPEKQNKDRIPSKRLPPRQHTAPEQLLVKEDRIRSKRLPPRRHTAPEKQNEHRIRILQLDIRSGTCSPSYFHANNAHAESSRNAYVDSLTIPLKQEDLTEPEEDLSEASSICSMDDLFIASNQQKEGERQPLLIKDPLGQRAKETLKAVSKKLLTSTTKMGRGSVVKEDAFQQMNMSMPSLLL